MLKPLKMVLRKWQVKKFKKGLGIFAMNKMRRGRLDLPSEDTDFEMYNYIIDSLQAAGYAHYEISNFGKTGYESAHNLMQTTKRSKLNYVLIHKLI